MVSTISRPCSFHQSLSDLVIALVPRSLKPSPAAFFQ